MISRGHTGSSLAGVQLEHYPTTTFPRDNVDNSKILFGVISVPRFRPPRTLCVAAIGKSSFVQIERGADRGQRHNTRKIILLATSKGRKAIHPPASGS